MPRFAVLTPILLAFASFAALLVIGVAAGGNAASAGIAQQQGKVQGQGQDLSRPDAPVGSGFTYWGRLNDPANGQYDFIFKLYDAASGGNQIGPDDNKPNQTVTDGIFTVTLDFGNGTFNGQARWLEIAVRPAGGGSYTTLSPRQALTATPYAQSLLPGSIISGAPGNPTLILTHTFGNGTGLHSSGGYYGVWGQGHGEAGVAGYSPSAKGVYGNSLSGTGVYGTSHATYGGYGVWGHSSNNWIGVFGTSGYIGVYGSGSGASSRGVYGEVSQSGAVGVYGYTSHPSDMWAGYFNGHVGVVNNVYKGGGGFLIDHPLDPANKYLRRIPGHEKRLRWQRYYRCER
jgi:hypothetical protein